MMGDSEEYLLRIIREQGAQIMRLAQSIQYLADAVGKQTQRLQLLEAREALEQMEEGRTVN